jgi:predicted nucleic acid-binding protein
LSGGGVLSTQVLIESANVMRRKFGCTVAEIETFHQALLGVCQLRIIERNTIRTALAVAGRYGFSTYDSLIIATALEAGCTTLYSEDMQHGQVIDGRLTVVNPFL